MFRLCKELLKRVLICSDILCGGLLILFLMVQDKCQRDTASSTLIWMMKEMVQENYNRIKEDVTRIMADELERIASDPALKHLLELNK